MILTRRTCLVPATADLISADLEDSTKLGKLLGAAIPNNWPPDSLADALPWFLGHLQADPRKTGWLMWYGIAMVEEGHPTSLAGSVGFTGPPLGGIVEVGYSMLPQFYGKGFATEMVEGLIRWAFDHDGVSLVAAEASSENHASLRVLQKLGFVAAGPGRDPGHLRFERPSPFWFVKGEGEEGEGSPPSIQHPIPA